MCIICKECFQIREACGDSITSHIRNNYVIMHCPPADYERKRICTLCKHSPLRKYTELHWYCDCITCTQHRVLQESFISQANSEQC